MKIETKQGYVAILMEDNNSPERCESNVVGVFKPSIDSRSAMESAVCMHFNVATCSLVTERDFTQPLDYNQPYTFLLYNGHWNGEDEYVTLYMTYAPVFDVVDRKGGDQ